MQELRVVVLVSSDPSDIFFANQLIKELNVVGVLVENQKQKINKLIHIANYMCKFFVNPGLLLKKISAWLKKKNYSSKTKDAVSNYFGQEGKVLFPHNGCEIIYTQGCKDINESVYVERVKKIAPDIIAVCGTSILKEEMLSCSTKGVLNLHGGLSQKYRGVWTTLWAIYNEEPEYIGATVHYVSSGIDDGDIVYQGRPHVVADDNPETLYAKVVKLGIKMMLKAIDNIQNNVVKSYTLRVKGDLYLLKMLTPDVLKEAWEKVDNGMIQQYVRDKYVRDKKVIEMMTGCFE